MRGEAGEAEGGRGRGGAEGEGLSQHQQRWQERMSGDGLETAGGSGRNSESAVVAAAATVAMVSGVRPSQPQPGTQLAHQLTTRTLLVSCLCEECRSIDSCGLDETDAATLNRLIQIDSRSFLEVADPAHRYAKNLRKYFDVFVHEACSEAFRTNYRSYGLLPPSADLSQYAQFFAWLDGTPRPEIGSCPRSVLDVDRVQYLCSSTERLPYRLDIDAEGLFRGGMSHRLVNTINKSSSDLGWIFVLRSNVIYAGEKITQTFPRFHHSSFFSGIVCITDGRLTKLYPHSGHYRPTDFNLLCLLNFLHAQNVALADVEVDGQRVFKMARKMQSDGAKVKKVDATLNFTAEVLMNFLRVKHKFHRLGLPAQIRDKASRLQHRVPSTSSLPSLSLGAVPSTDEVDEYADDKS